MLLSNLKNNMKIMYNTFMHRTLVWLIASVVIGLMIYVFLFNRPEAIEIIVSPIASSTPTPIHTVPFYPCLEDKCS